MVNLKKVVEHIKEVGVREFIREFKENREEVVSDPSFALKTQLQGQVGMIIFSIIASIMLFYNGVWYIAGVFIFNIWIVFGQLVTVRRQLKEYREMESFSPSMLESETKEKPIEEKEVLEFR